MKNLIEEIDKILPRFLRKRKISRLKKNCPGLSSAFAEQLDPALSDSDKYRLQIENIIKCTKDIMEKEEYILLLLFICDKSISYGEFSFSSKLFPLILSEIKNDPDLYEMEAMTHLSIADLYSRQSEGNKSIEHAKLAKAIYAGKNDQRGISKCDHIIGTIECERGNIEAGEEYFNKSNSYLNITGYSAGTLALNTAVYHNIRGEYDRAFIYYKQALVIFEKANNANRISQCRYNLGILYTQLEEYDKAMIEFDESISIAELQSNVPHLGLSYLSKAFVYTRLKEFQLANIYNDKSLEICTKLNDRASIAEIYKTKGIIERINENYKAAEDHFLYSIKINQEIENTMNEAETYYELGILYKEIGNKTEEEKSLIAALKYYKKTGVADMIKKIESLLWNLN